jgi:hypothetical protein
MLSDSESDSDNNGDNAVVPVTSPVGDGDAEAGPPVPEVDKATKALIAKMRDNAFEARKKKIELQELNLTQLWPDVIRIACQSTRISRFQRGQGLQRRDSTVGFHPEEPPCRPYRTDTVRSPYVTAVFVAAHWSSCSERIAPRSVAHLC